MVRYLKNMQLLLARVVDEVASLTAALVSGNNRKTKSRQWEAETKFMHKRTMYCKRRLICLVDMLSWSRKLRLSYITEDVMDNARSLFRTVVLSLLSSS